MVIDDPFVSRATIGLVAGAGVHTGADPFASMLRQRAASAGLAINSMTLAGARHPRLFLHSVLNTDAARAYRFEQLDAAKRLAARATELERTEPARLIQEAVQAASDELGPDPIAARLELRMDVDALDAIAGQHLDPALWDARQEWLVHATSWWTRASAEISEATLTLGQLVAEARSELIDDSRLAGVTFYGVVRRLDRTSAEIVGGAQTERLRSKQLSAQGLARVGQAVCILWETTPGRANETIVMPAADVGGSQTRTGPSSFDYAEAASEGIPTVTLDAEQWAWVERRLDGEPLTRPNHGRRK